MEEAHGGADGLTSSEEMKAAAMRRRTSSVESSSTAASSVVGSQKVWLPLALTDPLGEGVE